MNEIVPESLSSSTVVLRPRKDMLLAAFIPLLYGAMFFGITLLPDKGLNPPPSECRWQLLSLVVACVLTAIGMAVSSLRTQVIGDDSGVRWRGLWNEWRFVPWSEIGDYYEDRTISFEQGKSRKRYPVPVLVTTQGVVRLVDADPKAREAFRRLVQMRATSARVDHWAKQGVRRVDSFPQTFIYWQMTPFRIVSFLATTLLFYGVGIALSVRLLQYCIHWLGWQGSMPAIVCFLFALVALGYFPSSQIHAWIQQWQRRGERFTVTPEDLCYEDTRTGTGLTISWDEITDYHYAPAKRGSKSRYVLVLRGSDERQLYWDGLLQRSELLLDIVREYAPAPALSAADTTRWRSKGAHEATGGSNPDTWQSGAVGMGGRVFRYRNSSAIGAICVGAICGAIFLPLSLLKPNDSSANTQWFFGAVTLCLLLPTLWGLVCLLRSRIETDDMGITHFSVFGKKRLPWYTVADYGDKNDTIKVVGKNGVSLSANNMITGYDELKAEIQRLAPPPQTGWMKKADG